MKSAYSSLDGVPQVADYHTLTEILRDEWGFGRWVSSERGRNRPAGQRFPRVSYAAQFVRQEHHRGKMLCRAANAALRRDVEMGGGSFNFRSIPDLVRQANSIPSC